MEYIAYMDESGTHDKTGVAEGSAIGIISGFVSTPSIWDSFSQDLAVVLLKYEVPYFHFHEFADASGYLRGLKKELRSDYLKNVYKEWKLEKLDSFF
jgi:hypothetical protein